MRKGERLNTVRLFSRFAADSLRCVTRGNRLYWTWITFLLVLIAAGVTAYVHQSRQGLITTSMRDQVSWAFYIGNFTFLVGVAAAAVLLVIPAYVYEWKPIKEVVILGELLAISAKLKPAQGRIPDIDQIEPLVLRAKRLAAHCQERIESVRRLVDEQQVPT